MRNELLKLLSRNARYTNEQLAAMLNVSEAEIVADIAALEIEGVICGYKTVIDWDRVDGKYVSAIIEINVLKLYLTIPKSHRYISSHCEESPFTQRG